MKICKEYYNRLEKLHSEKYDLEYEVTIRDLEVSRLKSKLTNIDRNQFFKMLL